MLNAPHKKIPLKVLRSSTLVHSQAYFLPEPLPGPYARRTYPSKLAYLQTHRTLALSQNRIWPDWFSLMAIES
jgi:hypothetical protein